jgi:hypothetical protein
MSFAVGGFHAPGRTVRVCAAGIRERGLHVTDVELSTGNTARARGPEAEVASTIGVHGSVEAYEPPTIVMLGTLAELTGGPAGGDGDVNGGDISF